MIEQAGFDRNLYQSTAGTKHVNLRFPEWGALEYYLLPVADNIYRIFNTGSPWNNVAGQGPRNMDQLVAHYEKLNADVEEKKVKALEKKS
jgi:hypothetical protein